MNPIDKHFKSLINNIDDDGTINVRLHYGEITAIIECLKFAHMAAKYLSDAELKRGTDVGVRRMMSISKDAKELEYILSQHLDIGEPLNGETN